MMIPRRIVGGFFYPIPAARYFWTPQTVPPLILPLKTAIIKKKKGNEYMNKILKAFLFIEFLFFIIKVIPFTYSVFPCKSAICKQFIYCTLIYHTSLAFFNLFGIFLTVRKHWCQIKPDFFHFEKNISIPGHFLTVCMIQKIMKSTDIRLICRLSTLISRASDGSARRPLPIAKSILHSKTEHWILFKICLPKNTLHYNIQGSY